MRKLILSIQASLDGFVEGPNGDMSWIGDDDEDWTTLFESLKTVDTLLLGGHMFPGYASYWSATLKNPEAKEMELRYAQWASKIKHIVFSSKPTQTDWPNTTFESGDTKEIITKLKQQPGKDLLVWGGARFASTCINLGLIDEYRIVLTPVLLGGGKSLTTSLDHTQSLQLQSSKPLKTGMILLTYLPRY